MKIIDICETSVIVGEYVCKTRVVKFVTRYEDDTCNHVELNG